MKVQVLASVMNKEPQQIIDEMRIDSDAIIINQCDHYGMEEVEKNGHKIVFMSMAEKGIGRSRNNALMRADKDICLFSDEDIVYDDGYEEKIIDEFNKNPKADMIVFNIRICEERRTYYIRDRKRVHFYNCGRYGAVSFAIRTEKLLESGVTFSLLFGGGAKYSSGEDSLFIKEFMDKGYKVYTSPIEIGEEKVGESTWFKGYDNKFFYDRGVLYHFLYGLLAKPMAIRFLMAHKQRLCQNMTLKQAYKKMKDGIKQIDT